MAKCDFLLDFSGSSADLEKKLKSELSAYGGNLDSAAKTIHLQIPVVGTISGSYAFEANAIRIIIDSKPMLLSCDQIEKQIRNFLAER